MNLALTFCWKEWRAQRGLLLAYLGLVFACLTLGFSLVPTHLWTNDGFGARALSWFVVAGVIGVVAFVAPNLVRSEFGTKDDQFVRRLPGALAPAFAGKLLFFVLTLLSLPLLGLAAGEVILTALGHDWDKLYVWDWRGEVNIEWSAVVVIAGGALLLAPWVWAIGTWLPGGRMALGGTLLFVLLVGVGVFAVLRQSPNIEHGLEWWHWLWAVPPTGFAIAALSWIRGRRGGGSLRSARFGLCGAAIVFVPPSAWLGVRAWHYHHPDLTQLADMNVLGISPDGSYALAYGNTMDSWCSVPIRIDLARGTAEQLSGINTYSSPSLLRPHRMVLSGRQRHWLFHDMAGERERELLDLATGNREPFTFDKNANRPLPTADQHRRIIAELKATTALRLPGNRPVWCDDGAVWTTNADGSDHRVLDVDTTTSISPAGHAVVVYGGRRRVVDLTSGATLVDDETDAYLVRDVLLSRLPGKSGSHWTETRDGQKKPCAPLQACRVLGLVDDDHVLAARTHYQHKKFAPTRLFLYRPSNGTETDLTLPPGASFLSLGVVAPFNRWGSLLARDPAGRLWLHCLNGGGRDQLLLVDVAKLQVTELASMSDNLQQMRLLDWPDANTAVLLDGARIVRLDLTTNARTQLFPRPE